MAHSTKKWLYCAHEVIRLIEFTTNNVVIKSQYKTREKKLKPEHFPQRRRLCENNLVNAEKACIGLNGIRLAA